MTPKFSSLAVCGLTASGCQPAQPHPDARDLPQTAIASVDEIAKLEGSFVFSIDGMRKINGAL